MGKKMLGKKMAAIFLPIHFLPRTSSLLKRLSEGGVREFLSLALQRTVDLTMSPFAPRKQRSFAERKATLEVPSSTARGISALELHSCCQIQGSSRRSVTATLIHYLPHTKKETLEIPRSLVGITSNTFNLLLAGRSKFLCGCVLLCFWWGSIHFRFSLSDTSATAGKRGTHEAQQQ